MKTFFYKIPISLKRTISTRESVTDGNCDGKVPFMISELQIDKSDWSLCNQAVQNSVINILPRVGPLTVITTYLTVEGVRSKMPFNFKYDFIG